MELRDIIDGEVSEPSSWFLPSVLEMAVNMELVLKLFRWALSVRGLEDQCESADVKPDAPDWADNPRECEGVKAGSWVFGEGESVAGSFVELLFPSCGISLLKKPDTPANWEFWERWADVASVASRSIVS